MQNWSSACAPSSARISTGTTGLPRSGTDLDVVQTLMDMVRGGSVVVIPEKPIFSGGGIAWPPKKSASSFWGVENYDPPRYASVQERYLAQI